MGFDINAPRVLGRSVGDASTDSRRYFALQSAMLGHTVGDAYAAFSVRLNGQNLPLHFHGR
ncbi:hypothetical protein [Cerasicoccus frondis]|uniref:hypothetical protein n=1 Tax=Cerasicoccus frondis TaxID=490090 RepID=UPI002852911B|nr:hypothetical protein [Cerasicoccus frondis]